MSVAQPIIDSLIQNGEYFDSNQGYLGISGGDVSSRMIAYGLPEGAYVGAVNKDSGAEKAGIKEGDKIVARLLNAGYKNKVVKRKIYDADRNLLGRVTIKFDSRGNVVKYIFNEMETENNSQSES